MANGNSYSRARRGAIPKRQMVEIVGRKLWEWGGGSRRIISTGAMPNQSCFTSCALMTGLAKFNLTIE